MLSIKLIGNIATVIFSTIIFACSVAIVVAVKFQKKQKKKYEECVRLIKEKENGIFSVKNGLDFDEIKKIDQNIDVDKLMAKLYDIYLEFVDKLNNNSKNFNNILVGFIKEFYENKVNVYSTKNHFEIIDNIELINYSILKFNKDKLKFRIHITCFSYKKSNDEIISGSNLVRVKQIFILTYSKIKNKWLISNIEKTFEQKLGI